MKYKRNPNFELKEIAGDRVLIARGKAALDFSAVVLFNETGIVLWEALADWKTVPELAAVLIAQCEAPKDAAAQDAQTFLDKLDAEGLLEKQ